MIGPDATGVGWVFEYALVDETGKHDLAELRSLPGLEPALRARAVQGVAEVAPRRRLREAVPGRPRSEQAARPTAFRSATSSAQIK